MTNPPSNAAVPLRGHHLICLQFFQGEGYSAEFVENLLDVVTRLENGEPGVVVAGPDAVCMCCERMRDASCPFQEGAPGEIARLDALALDVLGMSPGDTFDFPAIRSRLRGLLERWAEEACTPCAWASICLPMMRSAER